MVGLNGIEARNVISESLPHPTGIKRKLKREKPLQYEQKEVKSSDLWDLIGDALTLHWKAGDYVAGVHRQVSHAVQNIVDNAFATYKGGTIAVLAIGMDLKELKRELKILTRPEKEREWGDRREKIRILKSYRLTEFIFDHHEERRQDLLNFIEARIERKEKTMRDTAKAFGIEIPSIEKFTFSEENYSFEKKYEKYLK